MIRFVPESRVEARDVNDNRLEHREFRMSPEYAEHFVRRPYEFTDGLIRQGTLPKLGCDCSQCRQDIDCCGREYPARHTCERSEQGIRVTTHYNYNI